jgi:CRISPR system Cascade subunit CasD
VNAPADPVPGLLLHLSAPLQAYGVGSRFPSVRDTATHPSRSALIGMIAAARGIARDDTQGLQTLRPLRFAIRIDRPGVIQRDFHTVGGGRESNTETIATAEGKPRELSKATLVGERYYLADAAFSIAVTAPDEHLIRDCANALAAPRWPTHLGRRACTPDMPVLLGTTDHALTSLLALPLHIELNRHRPDGTTVDFVADHPLDYVAMPAHKHTESPEHGARPAYTLAAEPASFKSHARAHTAVTYYRRRAHLPATVQAALGTKYLDAVTGYLTNLQEDHVRA